jgi:hypothetical protein
MASFSLSCHSPLPDVRFLAAPSIGGRVSGAAALFKTGIWSYATEIRICE